tara:strand:- start:3429 stop:4163 length:735 start_codon:yes stop_codon:yes gene_type:complete
MKKIMALIPARSGSKSVPHKNIKDVHGHPLIAYTILAALQCVRISRVIVSTDSKKIANVAKNYGAEIPFIRPDALAQDLSTDLDVIKHFFDNVDVNEVAYLRPTSPLRDPQKMSEIIDFYFSNSHKCSGVRSMQENPQPPYKVFKIEKDGYGSGFFADFDGIKEYTSLPRQMFPQSYMPNGYVDVCKKSTLLQGKSAFGAKIIPYITDHLIDLDTQAEFNLLDFQLSSQGHILLSLLNNKRKLI